MTVDAPDVDGLDAVFAADLADFVAARDALAKQLKAAGDKDASAAVKKLRNRARSRGASTGSPARTRSWSAS